MAWGENKFITFEGRIEGFSQKAIRFCGDNWTDFDWVPRITKKGDPIIEIITHDHDTGHATVKIAKWLVDKNEGWVE